MNLFVCCSLLKTGITFITSDDLDVWTVWIYIGDWISLCDSAYSKYVNYKLTCLHLSLLTLEGLMPWLGNYLGVR